MSLLTVQVPYASESNVADAVARAMEWERPTIDGDTEPIQAIKINPQLTRDDVIRIVLAEFNGVLAPKKVWARYSDIASRPHLEKVMKAIASEGN
ncbi:MAG TPA: hypothetical protein PLZ51_27195, partial [Aggregatilineales bacterium]|nr:hypothetical protein [Aggregatilineales bacterium]